MKRYRLTFDAKPYRVTGNPHAAVDELRVSAIRSAENADDARASLRSDYTKIRNLKIEEI